MQAEREAYEEWAQGNYGMSAEEYEDYVSMLEETRPSDVVVEEIRAIFAEAYLEEENRLNNIGNEQGRISESVEGSNEVLLSEQSDLQRGDESVSEGGQGNEVSVRTDSENAASQEEAGNEIKPVGRGAFGNIYDQFRGKAKEAIRFLLGRREGEALGALSHPEIGEISLVWGNKKAGLEKIASKHSEVIDNLQEIIEGMRVVSKSENRIKLESDTHFAVVSREYMGQPREQWLLTAYEKKETSKPTNSRMDVDSNLFGKSDGTATRQDLDVSSDGKDNKESLKRKAIVKKLGVNGRKIRRLLNLPAHYSLDRYIQDWRFEGGYISPKTAAEVSILFDERDALKKQLKELEKKDSTRARESSDVLGRIEDIAKEEERRKPLRARAREWEEKLGVKVRLMEDVADVKNASARRAILAGRKVTGWYDDATGEVYFYMPYLKNAEEVDLTYLHEVVAHKGLRQLLGEAGFNELCDKVYEMMSPEDRHKMLGYSGVANIADETERKRATADEYMAHLAEETKMNPTVWDEIVEFVKRILWKVIGKKYNKVDVAEIIRESYINLRDSANSRNSDYRGNENGGTRFSAKKKKALETESALREEHHPSVVSSADGAKILNNLDKAIKEYENNNNKRANTLIGDIARALNMPDRGKSSQYGTFEAKNGKVFTIRLSNHNATVSNFDNAEEDEGISIVVASAPNGGINNDGEAHIVEYYYNSIALRKAEGKPLAEIVKSIKQALYSGEYEDTTGLAQRQEVNGTRFRFVDEMTNDEIYDGLNELSGYSNGAYNLMNALEEYYGGRIVSASNGARRAIKDGLVPVPKGQYEGLNEEYHHFEFEDENGETFVKAVPFVEAEGVEENEGIRFRELEEVNAKFNEELQQQIDGTLPKGHVYQLGMPSEVLLSTGVPNLPIRLQASVLNPTLL